MKRKPIYCLLFALISVATVFADKPTLKIRSIEVDDNVYTPYYSVQTEQDHEQGAAQRWVRLTVEYSTSGGWIDELSIKHMALIPGHGEKNAVLDEEVTYLNIGPGNHVSYVYMHPNCVKRYESEANEIDIAVQFSINGENVATEITNKNKVKDWTTSTHTHRGHLLAENETPFWFVNYDFKEIIKTRAHNGHGVKQ